ncbi:DUF2141 domain-containing protein [Sphingomonas sp.]|uniref:DUF2141 domain-containing protein n=1 Tax=Sphingomonas sp. TaxID=28214 RepID=UPI0035BBAADA
MLLSLAVAGQSPAAPHGACPPAGSAAVLVDVTGFKARVGAVRVRLFGPPTSTYFDKKHALVRTEIAVPASGRVTICVPVPRPGVYAIDVRHDVNGNGKTDRADGGGASGNPRLGLLDVLLGRKPDPARVQVRVGSGVTTVSVTLMYLQGGAFKPWR